MPADKEFVEYILSSGEVYTPALLPPGISRGEKRQCYDNCAARALGGKYRYVEGIVKNPKRKDHWFLHAWLTDGVHAFDPTWICYDGNKKEVPFPSVYVGVEMPLEAVAEFMIETEYSGVFANAWRNPKIAKKCCSKIPAGKISTQFLIELIK